MLKKYMAMVLCFIITLINISACKEKQDLVTLSTDLTLNSSYSGSRNMTLSIPKTYFSPSQLQIFESELREYCPKRLNYSNYITEQNYIYNFNLDFSSYEDYKNKLVSILGYNPGVVMSYPDTIFAKGFRLQENFSSRDLLSFLQKISSKGPKNELFKIDSFKNSINLDNKRIDVGDFIFVNNVEGAAIDSITIDTVNHRDSYDRTFKFRIPKSSMDKIGKDVYTYMRSRTLHCSESRWDEYESGSEFTAIYNNLNLSQLNEFTNEIMNSHLCGKVEYSINEGFDSILNKEYIFREILDTSAYVSKENEYPSVFYNYSVHCDEPNAMIETEARYLSAGIWENIQNTRNNSFQFSNQSCSTVLQVPDGYICHLMQTDISCDLFNNGSCKRSVEFKYPWEYLADAEYTKSVIEKLYPDLDVNIKTDYDSSSVMCKVSNRGNSNDVSDTVSKIFGPENNINSSKPEFKLFSMYNKLLFVDNLDFSKLYLNDNKKSKINYIVNMENDSILDEVKCSGYIKGDKIINATKFQHNDIRFVIDDHKSTVYISFKFPNFISILFVIAVALVTIFFTVKLVLILRKNKNLTLLVPFTEKLFKQGKTIASEKEIDKILSEL